MDHPNSMTGAYNLRYSPSTGVLKTFLNSKSQINGVVPSTQHHVAIDSNDRSSQNQVDSDVINSTKKLVVDDQEVNPRKESRKPRKRCNKYPWLVALLCVALSIFVTLYAVERTKKRQLLKEIHEIDNDKKKTDQPPCFLRVTPQPLDLEAELDMKAAIHEATIELYTVFKTANYHAVSVKVSYMGNVAWKFNLGRMNYSDSMSRTPNSSTRYPVASITKVLTVLMLEKLVEDGTIGSKDDDISKYDPRFHINNPFNNDTITFRHLACMMSGFPRESPCQPESKTSFCPYSSDEMFDRIKELSLIQPPDVSPSYSNLALSVLGHVLEKIVGKNETSVSYESWLIKNILEPLGMKDSGFVLNSDLGYPVSSTLGALEATVMDWGWLRPGGGMYSTADDLGKLAASLLGYSKTAILKARTVKHLFKPAYIYPDGNGQGCPFEVSVVDPEGKEKSRIAYLDFAKDGSIFGYGSVFGIIPDLKLNINVLTAAPHSSAFYAYRAVRSIFVKAFDRILRSKMKTYNLPPSPELYVGSYKLKSYWPLIQKLVNITLEQNTLLISIEWMKAPLSYVSGSTLETLDFGKVKNSHLCSMRGYGLLREKYIFNTSSKGEPFSGFYVNGISVYGRAEFVRVT